ncbi:MAG: hypothetical protein V7640_282 [Betaproteobacteria bacterium]
MAGFVERVGLDDECRPFLLARLLPVRLRLKVGGPDLTLVIQGRPRCCPPWTARRKRCERRAGARARQCGPPLTAARTPPLLDVRTRICSCPALGSDLDAGSQSLGNTKRKGGEFDQGLKGFGVVIVERTVDEDNVRRGSGQSSVDGEGFQRRTTRRTSSSEMDAPLATGLNTRTPVTGLRPNEAARLYLTARPFFLGVAFIPAW